MKLQAQISPAAERPAVPRFEPIEGLRAWLAWGVFFGHVALFAGLNRVGLPERVGDIASDCVQVFVILSGFVITHLLLTRPEGYLPYIAKRFFRLFPAFAVSAACGAAIIAISRTPWPTDPSYQYGQQLFALQEAQAHHFAAHVFLHLTMLHGAVPNNVLNVSQWALLPVAWSVSLEWQFYLLAPLILWLFRRRSGAALLLLLTAAAVWSYGRGLLGTYQSPSSLPAAAAFFLLGIGSRLMCGGYKSTRPAAVAGTMLAAGLLIGQVPIASWLAFVTYLFCDRNAMNGLDASFVRTADRLFNSRLAHWAGKRTYCVYLVHYPVYQLILTALTWAGLTSPALIAGLLLVFGLPLTAIAAEGLHRGIEVPGIQVGKQIAAWLPRLGKPDVVHALAS